MKALISSLAIFLMMTVFYNSANSQSLTDGMIKTSNGVKAVLKIDVSKSMVDLYLYDMAKNLTNPIKDAKVMADITAPSGKKVQKELIGMKMGEVFSYMNTLDMSEKGRYSFDISVQSGKRRAAFNFAVDIK